MSIQFRNDFKVDLIDSMGTDQRVVEAARVSTLNHDRHDNPERLIKYLLKHRHWSPFTHVTFTIRSELPISIARQVMRHQSQDFNEMSMRYSEALPHFFVPNALNMQSKTMKQGRADPLPADLNSARLEARRDLYETIWEHYQQDIKLGVAREQARDVLPVSTYTILYTTMNLRSALHFLGDRLDATAQSEAQQYAQAVHNAIADKAPITFKTWRELNTPEK